MAKFKDKIPEHPYTRAQLERWAREHLEVLKDCVLVRPDYTGGGFDLDGDMTKPGYMFAISYCEARDPNKRRELEAFIREQAEAQLEATKDYDWKVEKDWGFPEKRQWLERLRDDPGRLIDRARQTQKPNFLVGKMAERTRDDLVDYISTFPNWLQVLTVESEKRIRSAPVFGHETLNRLSNPGLQTISAAMGGYIAFSGNFPPAISIVLLAANYLLYKKIDNSLSFLPVVDKYDSEATVAPWKKMLFGFYGMQNSLGIYRAWVQPYDRISHELWHLFDSFPGTERISLGEGFRQPLLDGIRNKSIRLGRGRQMSYSLETRALEAFGDIGMEYLEGCCSNRQVETEERLTKKFGDAFIFFRDEAIPQLQHVAGRMYHESRYRSSPDASPAR